MVEQSGVVLQLFILNNVGYNLIIVLQYLQPIQPPNLSENKLVDACVFYSQVFSLRYVCLFVA